MERMNSASDREEYEYCRELNPDTIRVRGWVSSSSRFPKSIQLFQVKSTSLNYDTRILRRNARISSHFRKFSDTFCITMLMIILNSKGRAQNPQCRDHVSVDCEYLSQFRRICSNSSLNVSMKCSGSAGQQWDSLYSRISRSHHMLSAQFLAFLLHKSKPVQTFAHDLLHF
jgi:hypothetical protein